MLRISAFFVLGIFPVFSQDSCWTYDKWMENDPIGCTGLSQVTILHFMLENAEFCDFCDPIVRKLIFIPAGTFTQGSPGHDPCRWGESQFTHTLTRNILVMETEISRQMWADLKAVQPTLLNDISSSSSVLGYPVDRIGSPTPFLFANLLSIERGLTPCYYVDALFSIPTDRSNYLATRYCNFDAEGYRLPTEGEWEYFARAGTTGPFFVEEPNYNSSNCMCSGELYSLQRVANFCNRSGSPYPVDYYYYPPNPWGLKGVLGNVGEVVWDGYESHYPSGHVTDFVAEFSSFDRVVRGGNYADEAADIRAASRWHWTTHGVWQGTGFRLVRTVPNGT